MLEDNDEKMKCWKKWKQGTEKQLKGERRGGSWS
jgi:hypothetical protein